MSESHPKLILHQYDESPYSQKAIKMLALKRLPWTSVAMPYFAPKPELTRLTAGYRGTPIMQIAADIYVDTFEIALELERRFPHPTLFPNGSEGICLALAPMGDAIFEPVLRMAIKTLGPTWDDATVAERRAVYSRLEWDAMPREYAQNAAAIRAWAAVIDTQLADGRAFLLGTAASLADIHAYTHIWSARQLFPETERLLQLFKSLPPWEKRMAALGEGDRISGDVALAYSEAAAFDPVTAPVTDIDDPLGLPLGIEVTVTPTGSNRGSSTGTLVALSCREVVISHQDAELGRLHVHFPRIGYRVHR